MRVHVAGFRATAAGGRRAAARSRPRWATSTAPADAFQPDGGAALDGARAGAKADSLWGPLWGALDWEALTSADALRAPRAPSCRRSS